MDKNGLETKSRFTFKKDKCRMWNTPITPCLSPVSASKRVQRLLIQDDILPSNSHSPRALNNTVPHKRRDRIHDSTSCVRVGRGSDAILIAFRRKFHQRYGRTNRRTDRVPYRLACTRLKTRSRLHLKTHLLGLGCSSTPTAAWQTNGLADGHN